MNNELISPAPSLAIDREHSKKLKNLLLVKTFPLALCHETAGLRCQIGKQV